VTRGVFDSLPLNITEAKRQGWEGPEDPNSCDPNFGLSFQFEGDVGLFLLYGADRALYGVQAGIITQPPQPVTPPWEDTNNGLWTLTLFFRDPALICSNTNQMAEKEEEDSVSIGDRLVLRHGSTGRFIDFPLLEKDLDPDWVRAPCIYTLGTHYWLNVSMTMDCNEFYPLGLMYNDYGKLDGFVITSTTLAGPSDRWEHPYPAELQSWFYPSSDPSCLYKGNLNISTMHFFTRDPEWNTCHPSS